MREILFRGKRLDNGEWVEGVIVASRENTYPNGFEMITVDGINYDELDSYIPDFTSYAVDPNTVGQYTGLKDKNGRRIFEGDIVAQNWYDYDEPRDDSFGKVVFCEYDCSFSVMDVNKDGFMPLGRCGSYHWEVEVIGHIHDNPELLKGGDG